MTSTPRMIAVRDPEDAVACLAAACLALDYVRSPETFPAFLAWMHANSPPDDTGNPDAETPLPFAQALTYLDSLFDLLGGRE